MKKNKLVKHMSKHYKKKARRASSIVNNNFWGWKSYSRGSYNKKKVDP